MVPLTDEQVAAAKEADPTFTALSLPAGSYEGVAEDVATIGVPNVLVVSSEMDEETVYQITRAMFENIGELQAVHPAANETTIEFTMSATPVPLHPGAIRYYEETGAEIPDNLRE
jgi:TRAP transporter TAXI family solute receptor